MPNPPRKRPTRATVKAKIIAAAEKEFIQHGYASTKLDAIAKRAGFTKGALYSNFDSKAALFLALIEQRMSRVLTDQMATVLASSGDSSSSLDVKSMARALAHVTKREEAWHLLIMELALLATQDASSAALYQRGREVVHAQIHGALTVLLGPDPQGEVRRSDVVTTLIISLVNAVALDGILAPERYTLELRTALFESALSGGLTWDSAAMAQNNTS